MTRSSRRLSAVTLAVLLTAAACGGDSGDGNGLSGAVLIDGSSTVGPLTEVAAELFMNEEEFSNVRVTVAISGTGGGFQKFCIGETDGNDSSRPIRDDEAALCASNGIDYDFVQFANDALTILVNNDLPLECLTVEQVSQIWNFGSTVNTWGEIDGLDLPEEWANEPLRPYGPGSDSGTFDFFTEEINGEVGQIRIDYIDIGEDDLAAVRAIQTDRGATGYIPFSYYQEVLGDVKGLAIDGGDGCVEPTPDNVRNGTYQPLGRPLFVYFSSSALARPEVLAFAEFYVDNAVQIAELAEFVPMTAEQQEEARQRVANLAG
ncbi:MAG TPA: PstS family phosphate ABC transporter substrate-binding protein [Acidimicrobiia bacterium]|nr:PstS family phosphate ABC transporter substrate-binding protein [Acidimicrobiia bacterium]